MAETVQVNRDLLTPGTTVRFDFDLGPANEVQQAETIREIKYAVWSDDQFDYQGSEIQSVHDTETNRDIRMLSIYVTVRKTRRQARGEITYASMSLLEALVRSTPEALGYGIKHFATHIVNTYEAIKETAQEGLAALPSVATVKKFSLGVLLIGLAVAYVVFVPRRA